LNLLYYIVLRTIKQIAFNEETVYTSFTIILRLLLQYKNNNYVFVLSRFLINHIKLMFRVT